MKGKEKEIVNLTAHDVTIFGDDGEIIATIKPSGIVARIEEQSVDDGDINGIPVVRTQYGDIKDLPDPAPGRVYIVSTIVAQQLGGKRPDVLAPDSGPGSAVRDEYGRIKGIMRLRRF